MLVHSSDERYTGLDGLRCYFLVTGERMINLGQIFDLVLEGDMEKHHKWLLVCPCSASLHVIHGQAHLDTRVHRNRETLFATLHLQALGVFEI